jgi:hypothetical protein
MSGFAAATELLSRAFANGFLIEAVVLGAVVIDGCLRIGLILDHQIRTRSDQVLEDLLFQRDNDRIVTERQVYERALQASVISKDIFDELSTLYSERNRVVHRYVISDITTEQVFRIAHRYEQAIPRVNEAIWVLEDKQIRLGVGMVRREQGAGDPNEIRRMAEKKHAAEWLARAVAKRAT